MTNPKVSVIIPVYNTKQDYIHRCILSILNQDYKYIEIIIVDDGSDEPTALYCDSLKKNNERITVIHQKNSGVSVARNNAIACAKGDYFLYVDSDDELLPGAIRSGVDIATSTDADVVIGTTKKCRPDEECICTLNSKNDEVMMFDTQIKNNVLRDFFFGVYDDTVCQLLKDNRIERGPFARLIKREIAQKTLFPVNMPIGEDIIWNMRLLSNSNKVYLTSSCWYKYMIYSDSAIRKYYGNRVELCEKYLKILISENKFYFRSNRVILGIHLLNELYAILNYDLLSNKNSMSIAEKDRYVADFLKRQPWHLIYKVKYGKKINNRFKVFLFTVKHHIWIPYLKANQIAKKVLMIIRRRKD